MRNMEKVEALREGKGAGKARARQQLRLRERVVQRF
jgi:hypothetical protein